MCGTDRVRRCDACGLLVYNLSAMTVGEALALIQETEGRRCVRFYRRADGTVLTRDCPEAPYDLAQERVKGALVTLVVLTVWLAATPFADAAWTLARRALKAAAHLSDAPPLAGSAGMVVEATMGEPIMGNMMSEPLLPSVEPPPPSATE